MELSLSYSQVIDISIGFRSADKLTFRSLRWWLSEGIRFWHSVRDTFTRRPRRVQEVCSIDLLIIETTECI